MLMCLDCDQIDDGAVRAMIGLLLNTLKLKGCKKISDAALLCVAQSESLNNSLVNLNLDCCHQIKDDAVLMLVNKCTALRTLNLFCARVTDDCIQKIKDLKPLLQVTRM